MRCLIFHLLSLSIFCWSRCDCGAFAQPTTIETTVTSQAELESALHSGSYISLGADILLTKAVQIIGLSNLTLNGHGYSLDGQNRNTNEGARCLFIHSSSVKMLNVQISRCYSNDRGGGLYIQNSTVTLSRCEVSENTASVAAGIYAEASVLHITSSSFVSNEATAIGGNGGGLYAHQSFVTCEVSSFLSNIAGDKAVLGSAGGGLYSTQSIVRLRKCTLELNSAAAAGGAALFDDGSDLIIESCNISKSNSQSGGALYIRGSAAKISLSTFSDNTATSAGGALQIASAVVEFYDNVVMLNTAIAGGGIFIDESEVNISNSRFIFNNALGSGSGVGAGLYIQGRSEVWMQHCSINFNVVQGGLGLNGGGAGLYLDGFGVFGPTVTIKFSEIKNNAAEGFLSSSAVAAGGGVFAFKSTLKMSYCEISGNSLKLSGTGIGGGLHVSSSSAEIWFCSFDSNSAVSKGGAVYVESLTLLSDVVMVSCVISNNNASAGAGVYFVRSDGLLHSCSVYNNLATLFGGGSYFTDSIVVLLHSLMWGNQAGTAGGLFCQLSDLTFNSSSVHDNVAFGSAGGVKILVNSKVFASHSVFSNNSAKLAPAGGIYVDKSELTMVGVKISGNTALGYVLSSLDCPASDGCITTIYYGQDTYPSDHDCTFHVLREGNLAVSSFDLYQTDYLTVGGSKYSGLVGPDGVLVAAGDTILFSSSTGGNTGFEICLSQPSSSGGGVYVLGANVVIVKSSFENNEASEFGGAVSLNGGSLILASVQITNNIAVNGGDAVRFDAGYFEGNGLTLTGNVSGSSAASAVCGSLCTAGSFGVCEVATGSSSCFVNCNCKQCPNGTYSNTEASTASWDCIQCGPGQVSSQGATECRSCAAGMFAANYSTDGGLVSKPIFYGAAICNPCPASTFSSREASVACDRCPERRNSVAGSASCDLAAAGYFFDPSLPAGSEPMPCPRHATCKGDDLLPIPDEHFWVERRNTRFAGQMHYCPRGTCRTLSSSLSCWTISAYGTAGCSSNDLQCIDGANGVLCGSCEASYIFSSPTNLCERCSSITTFDLALFGFGATVLFLWFAVNSNVLQVPIGLANHWIVCTLKEAMDSGSAKVLFTTYQIVSSVSSTGASFPDPFIRLLRWLSIFSFDFLSLSCTLKNPNYVQEVFVWSLFPLTLSLGVIATCALRLQFPAAAFGNSKTKLLQDHTYAFLLISFLCLPIVTQKQFTALDCVLVSHRLYLRVDTSISCTSTFYRHFIIFDLFAIAIYLSCPLIWLVLLRRQRHRLNLKTHDEKLLRSVRSRDEAVKHLSFLFGSYLGPYYYFEVVEMLRRILLIGVVPLVSTRSSRRAAVGMLAAIISIAFYHEVMPYNTRATNLLVLVAQYVLFATYGSALVLTSDLSKNTNLFVLGTILLIAQFILIAMALFAGFRRYMKIDRTSLRRIRQLEQAPMDLTLLAPILDGLSATEVAPNSSLVLWYGNVQVISSALHFGIDISSDLTVSLLRPHELDIAHQHSFPDCEAFLCMSVPRRLLAREPVNAPGLFRVSARACEALRAPSAVSVLPVYMVVRAFRLYDTNASEGTATDQSNCVVDAVHKGITIERPFSSTAMKSPGSYLELLGLLQSCRSYCARSGLFLVFYVTDKSFATTLQDNGILVPSGGVYFSVVGPLSLGLGTAEYQPTLKLHFPVVREHDDSSTRGNLDLVVAYAAEPAILSNAPGASENIAVVPRNLFSASSTPDANGDYFLRPDRMLCLLHLPPENPPRGREAAKLELCEEISRDQESKDSFKERLRQFQKQDNEVVSFEHKLRSGVSFASIPSLEDGHRDDEIELFVENPIESSLKEPLLLSVSKTPVLTTTDF